MFVLKNRHAAEPSEANCRTKFSRSKQLLKKYSSSDVSIVLFTDEKTFSVATSKKLRE